MRKIKETQIKSEKKNCKQISNECDKQEYLSFNPQGRFVNAKDCWLFIKEQQIKRDSDENEEIKTKF